MQAWKNKSSTPFGGWRYYQKETGQLIRANNWSALINAVYAHRVANELPVEPGLEGEIEEFMCHEVPDGCEEARKGPTRAINFNDVVTFTKTLVETFLRGNPRVDQSEADRRAKICGHCPDNIDAEGCKSCKRGALEKLVSRLSGDRQTKGDELLKSCRHCGCFNRAQVWFPLDILQKNQRDEVRDALPQKCWKK